MGKQKSTIELVNNALVELDNAKDIGVFLEKMTHNICVNYSSEEDEQYNVNLSNGLSLP